jgi:AcrR family transcriptional regulator
LDASVALLAAHGLEGDSTTRIAVVAGISQSLVLYHFGSKEALWREAMRHLFARVGPAGVASTSDTRDLDPLLRLKVALRRFVRVSCHYPEVGRIIMREGAQGGARLDWLMANALAANDAVYTGMIEDAQAVGLVRPHPPFQRTILPTVCSASKAIAVEFTDDPPV